MPPCVTYSLYTALRNLIVSCGTMCVILVLSLVVELQVPHVCTSGIKQYSRGQSIMAAEFKLSCLNIVFFKHVINEQRVCLHPVDPVKERQLTFTHINSGIKCFSCYKSAVKVCVEIMPLYSQMPFFPATSSLTWRFWLRSSSVQFSDNA